MKKTLTLILATIFAILMFASCQESPARAPDIRVTSGDMEIRWTVGLNKWDGAVYDRQESFQYYFDSDKEPGYLEIGSEIVVKFEGDQQDSIQMTDAVLTENGKLKYKDTVTKQIELTGRGNTFSFPLEQHFAVFLSSDSADYEPKSVIRGFKLLCTWGENECEYAFVIRTDPQ